MWRPRRRVRHRRIDDAGHAEIDDLECSAGSSGGPADLTIDEKPVRTRRGDDSVDVVECGRQGWSSGTTCGTGFPSGLDRVMCRPAGHEQAARRGASAGARAPDGQPRRRRRPARHGPRAIPMHAREVTRRPSPPRRALADACLGTRTAARAQDAGESLARGSDQPGRPRGPPQRHAGSVPRFRPHRRSASRGRQRRGRDAATADRPACMYTRRRVASVPVSATPQFAFGRAHVASNRHDFHTMARREDEQFSDARRRATSQRGRSSSQAAANIHGRGAMTRADEKEVQFCPLPFALCPS